MPITPNMINDVELSVCEEQVFERVFKTHSKMLRNFMYARCGNEALAEDLTQNAFVQLWKNCAKVPLNKARSFLLTVIKNAHYNEINKANVILKYKKSIKRPVDHETPEFLLREKEFQRELNDAINKLRAKDREVFLLHRIEKRKYAEIAELLSISVKTVEKRMHDALVELRTHIKNYKF
ncbi:MAG: sigma-70 family RNA polymerase sigma factor [Bacteroidota bacterium]